MPPNRPRSLRARVSTPSSDRRSEHSRPRAFTLIELLVVVAVVAILAAVAVPNFLEAQVRAKVSRAHNDLRTLAVASEAYYADHNAYPPTDTVFLPLLFPIEYMADPLMPDPFDHPEPYLLMNLTEDDPIARAAVAASFPFDPAAQEKVHQQNFLFTSAGPDGIYIIDEIDGDPNDELEDQDYIDWLVFVGATGGPAYDPSNGTLSDGDIGRTGKGVARPFLFQ